MKENICRKDFYIRRIGILKKAKELKGKLNYEQKGKDF